MKKAVILRKKRWRHTFANTVYLRKFLRIFKDAARENENLTSRGVKMALKNLKFEYEVCPDRDGNRNKLISLEKRNDKYYLEYSYGNNLYVTEISSKIDKLYQGLLMMDIKEWNQQCFDDPMDMYPSYLWRLEILADDINVSCKGKDNLPKNWDEFKILLCEIGIESNFPF